MSLDAAACRRLLAGWQRASSATTGDGAIGVTSTHLRDELVQLCLHAGFTAVFRRAADAQWLVLYDDCASSDALARPVLNTTESGQVCERKYTGRVW